MVVPELLGGRYALGGVLGRGGMAEVREGIDMRSHQIVAIKLLYRGYDSHPEYLRRFWEEAQAAISLRHPNIVACYGAGEHNGTPFIVMERLPGRSLADLIAQGPLPLDYVCGLLGEVLAALAVAHRAGIVHRDIKPANILFTDSGVARVSDFGLAKGPHMHRTEVGRIMGTMAYMSPQRLAGGHATIADDIYAVGVVGYEALTGRAAFPEANLVALTTAITVNPPPPLSAWADVDPRFAAIVDRAMMRDPSFRFTSAEAMRAELAAVAADLVTRPLPIQGPVNWRAAAPPGPLAPGGARPGPSVRRRPRRTALWAAFVVAFLLASMVWAIVAAIVVVVAHRTPPI
jgi:serine/threonine protein kinase